MKNRRSETGERPAVAALIASLVIFVTILTRGWGNFFSSKGLLISIFLGLVIALIAVAFAWAIANERLRRPGEKKMTAAYFFFLFNLSALGTINAAFVTFQSGNVFREEIDKASIEVGKLQDIGKANLATNSYDIFYRSAMDAWSNLRAELENPALCGQGSFALKRAGEVKSVLPKFELLAWSGKCEDVPNMVLSYRKQIDSLIANSDEYAEEQGTIRFRDAFQLSTKSMKESLKELAENSSTKPDIQASKANFFKIAREHSDLGNELLSQIQPTKVDMPKIDVSTISALGEIGQIIPFLMSRWYDISTYVYIVFAILIDIVVIAAFMAAMRRSDISIYSKNNQKSASKLY